MISTQNEYKLYGYILYELYNHLHVGFFDGYKAIVGSPLYNARIRLFEATSWVYLNIATPKSIWV
jgi:hypothetical protein